LEGHVQESRGVWCLWAGVSSVFDSMAGAICALSAKVCVYKCGSKVLHLAVVWDVQVLLMHWAPCAPTC
jgi:hypothetical protein